MKDVVITGGHGFLGWHLACQLRALFGLQARRLGRRTTQETALFSELLGAADTVFHLAGVNRATTDAAVEEGNVECGRQLAEAIRKAGRPMHVINANSIQCELDNAYGRGKRAAAVVIAEAVEEVGGTLTDVILPNLFGEHGRPNYNSFVATFAHAVAHDQTPQVRDDHQVPLLHAQRAAAVMIDAARSTTSQVVRPEGRPTGIAEVLAKLRGFHGVYAERGELPDLSDPFALDLFNTYRSYLFPQRYPMLPQVHGDDRGALFETVRVHGGTGQAFVSTTLRGARRGEHYHLHKVERFCVVKGEGLISLRRLLHDEVVTFRLSGDRPAFVDMPTLWVHNIVNVGAGELVTAFWSDRLLDDENPDQYPEQVGPGERVTA